MPRPIALAGALVLALGCVAGSSAAEETRPLLVTPGVTPAPERPATPDPLLVTTGVVLLGLPYAGSAYVGATSTVVSDRWLYAPVVGPFADLVARATCQTYGCKGDLGTVPLPLTIDGLVQAAGAAVLLHALLAPGPTVPPPAQGASLHVVPAGYPGGGGGVSAFGTF